MNFFPHLASVEEVASHDVGLLARLRERVAHWQSVIEVNPKSMGTCDFETRSTCDLNKHGAWIYSKDPTTEALCLSYKLPGYEKVKRWWPTIEVRERPWDPDSPAETLYGSGIPEDLWAFIIAGGLMEGHNVGFERYIWKNVMTARHGWPHVAEHQWRCSAAKCSAAVLPRDLGRATVALQLSQVKDDEGRKLMLKMCKPRKPRKAELAHMEEMGIDPTSVTLYYESIEMHQRLQLYCDQDVRSEEALSEAVRDLSETELQVWMLDQFMNERGVCFDVRGAKAALQIAKRAKKVLNAELHQITGSLTSAGQRAKILVWCNENGELGQALPDTTGATVDWFLDRVEMTQECYRVLQIVKQANRTSIRKYQAIIDFTDPEDGRARDQLMYHGAGTGRFSGKSIQVQNFPRGVSINYWYIKDGKEYGKFDMDRAWEDITGVADMLDKAERLEWSQKRIDKELDEWVAWIYAMHGDVMEFLSSSTRGALTASKGMKLVAADYSAIEARVIMWMAECQAGMDALINGDIYCDMAEGIYGYDVNKQDHPSERQFGKQAILGLGFEMGWLTFLITCRKYKIYFSEKQVQEILGDSYDEKYWKAHKALFFDKHPKYEEERLKLKNLELQGQRNAGSLAGKKMQSRKARHRFIDAREKPEEIVHEIALMMHTVGVYRSRYGEVKQMWRDLEEAAVGAMLAEPGTETEAAKCKWFTSTELRVNDDFERLPPLFLYCELPSGRLLSYVTPFLKDAKTPWGEIKKDLRYYTMIVGNKWATTYTYGGKLAENVVQAAARDSMVEAALKIMTQYPGAEKYDTLIEKFMNAVYIMLISVHDELVAECDERGSKEEFEGQMSNVSAREQGCPITAEAESYPRYRK